MDIVAIIVIVLFILVILGLIYWSIKKKGLRKVIIELIILAEKTYKKGENERKFKFVLNRIYKALPKWLRFFVLEQDIEYLIQKVFDEIKDALDYGGKS